MRKLAALIAGAALLLVMQTGGVAAHHGCEYDCSTTTSSSSTESTSTTESSSTTETTTTETTETVTTTVTTTESTTATPKPTTTPPPTASEAPADPSDGQNLWLIVLALAGIGGIAVIVLPKRRSN